MALWVTMVILDHGERQDLQVHWATKEDMDSVILDREDLQETEETLVEKAPEAVEANVGRKESLEPKAHLENLASLVIPVIPEIEDPVESRVLRVSLGQ